MKPKDSLPYSQKALTGMYLEPYPEISFILPLPHVLEGESYTFLFKTFLILLS